MKICYRCKLLKEENNFCKDKRSKDGLNEWCRQCVKVYREKNNVEILEGKKRYYRENKKKILDDCKKYYSNCKEKSNKQSRLYYSEHKTKIKQRVRELEKEKLKTNLEFRLKYNLRRRLGSALKGNFKSGSAVRDLGCSIEDFKIWLEQQFYINPETGESMTWENYGSGWHIDHIIPLFHFDLSNTEQVKKACHWFNLRPLWAKENMAREKTFGILGMLVP